MLEINSQAPNFELHNQENKLCCLEDYKGQQIVLYFYPKDNTPGCTTQAKEFSSLKGDFSKHNTIVLGVSKDSVASHKSFCEKQALSIDLLSDESLDTLKAYGVWQEKKNYGKTYMGIVRSTVLIDSEGKIKRFWKNVKAAGHAQHVLETVVNF